MNDERGERLVRERGERRVSLENDFQNKQGENVFHLLKYVFSIDQKIDSPFIFHAIKHWGGARGALMGSADPHRPKKNV